MSERKQGDMKHDGLTRRQAEDLTRQQAEDLTPDQAEQAKGGFLPPRIVKIQDSED
jgi:hypothetical protein